MRGTMTTRLSIAALGGAASLCVLVPAVIAAPYATSWVEGHNSKTRLIVGGAPRSNGTVQRYAALEMVMPAGWKTYWRQPGSAGGIPPQLSWQGSVNLKQATLKFPAPIRMVDPTGATIGYKKRVIFPIEIEAIDAVKPITLNVQAFFGVCREICIPAQAKFKVTLPPELFRQTPPELATALARLPAPAGSKTRPLLRSVSKARTSKGGNTLIFDVRMPSAKTAGGDLFVETGDHRALPMSKAIASPEAATVRYQVVVTNPAQWRALADNGLVVTMVSDAGASEARVPRP